MNVIIVVGSKHGSTRGIAEAVEHELSGCGIDVVIADANDSDLSLAGFDAAVVGSAVYVGHWMKDARTFLETHREPLRTMPVWLFSSGPLGGRSIQSDELADAVAFADDLHVRDHRTFTGSLDKAELNLAERTAVRLVHAPYGDDRDWDEIRSWARSIAAELSIASETIPPVAATTVAS